MKAYLLVITALYFLDVVGRIIYISKGKSYRLITIVEDCINLALNILIIIWTVILLTKI